MKLICVFVFAYADCWFSHEAAQLGKWSIFSCSVNNHKIPFSMCQSVGCNFSIEYAKGIAPDERAVMYYTIQVKGMPGLTATSGLTIGNLIN